MKSLLVISVLVLGARAAPSLSTCCPQQCQEFKITQPTISKPKFPPLQVSQYPVSQVSQLPAPEVSQFSVSQMSKLPITQVSQLPAPEVSQFPASQMYQFPVSQMSHPPIAQFSLFPATQFSQVSVPEFSKPQVPVVPQGPESQLTQPEVTTSQFTKCYTGPDQTGKCALITTSVPDLGLGDFDNKIQSALQTGMWLYYENTNYNKDTPGRVYYAVGSMTPLTFPYNFRNVISSVRPIGVDNGYGDMLVGYEGIGFTGMQYYWTVDVSSFDRLMGKLASIIITGTSAWTVYTGESFNGNHMCVYPDLNQATTSGPQGFTLGMYANMTMLGIPNNRIMSAKKGCWSRAAAKPPLMRPDGRHKNGHWGRIM